MPSITLATQYRRRTRTEAIILHHTGPPTTPETTVESIRAYHRRRGWIDIGYNFLIRRGARCPGRPIWAVGSHAPGWNVRSIGVALVGDHTAEPPALEQLAQLHATLSWLLGQYPGARILRHDQAMAEVGRPTHTTCPGLPWEAPVLESLAAAGIYYRGG